MKNVIFPVSTVAALMFLAGCGGGGGGGDHPVGKYRADMSGGSATMVGGRGGGLIIRTSGVSVESQRASARVEIPDVNFSPDFGEQKVTIAGDVEVPLVENDTDEPAAGNLYLLKDKTDLYISDGDQNLDTHRIASGLEVASGATLTLSVNDTDNQDDCDGRYAIVYFNNDVVIRGTVTVTATENVCSDEDEDGNVIGYYTRYEKGSLKLHGARFFIDNDGVIDMTGLDTASFQGNGSNPIIAKGGDVRLYATDQSQSKLIVKGKIDVSGGTDTLDPQKQGGGSGGSVKLIGSTLSLERSALIQADGHSGRDWGGDGGEIMLNALVEYYNQGTLSFKGGDAKEGADDAKGGEGGIADLIAVGEEITFIQTGSIEAYGGDANGSGSYGGNGKGVRIVASDRSDEVHPVIISGDIDLHGGNADEAGGSGGLFIIEANYPVSNAERKVMIAGYKRYDLSGNDGALSGGAGGRVFVNIRGGSNSFMNDVDIVANGGDALELDVPYRQGSGGDGGSINLDLSGVAHGENSGNIYLNGGKSYGGANNSDGGDIDVCVNDPADFTISGSVYQNAGTGGTGDAGEDGEIDIDSCN